MSRRTDDRSGSSDAGDRPVDAPAIDVADVSRSFGDVDVLRSVSLSIEPGTFVGLVGPNGAGKTTLLRTISGALEPDAGRVAVEGADVHALSSRASSRLVSVVPQDTTLSFSFDVRSVVEMGRTPYRSRFASPTPEDRERVERALERTETAGLADRPIDAVSGGERQRVVLARALAQDTPVVLLDEPTASLDVNHQVETLELVADLVADGKTAVAAIHDLDLAARYCDALAVLAEGRIVEHGPPEAVLASDVLERAFDATAAVTTDPVTGSPRVTAIPAPDRADVPDRVHVVGGGEAAAGAVARLEAAGVDVSVGPVALDDLAATTAERVGAETVTVEPFAALSDADRAAVADRLAACEATVLADLRAGAGNQRLLEVLEDAPAPVVLESAPFSERNAAGTAARERYEAIRERSVECELETVLEAVCEAVGRVDRRERPPIDVDAEDD